MTRRLQLRGAECSKPNSRPALPPTINAFSAADRKSQCTRMKSIHSREWYCQNFSRSAGGIPSGCDPRREKMC